MSVATKSIPRMPRRDVAVLTLGALGVVGFIGAFAAVAGEVLNLTAYVVMSAVSVALAIASLVLGHCGRER